MNRSERFLTALKIKNSGYRRWRFKYRFNKIIFEKRY